MAVDSPTDQSAIAARMAQECAALVRDEVVPNVDAWDREDVLPQALLDRLAQLGVPGALVPTRYGGPGLGLAAMVDVFVNLLAALCPARPGPAFLGHAFCLSST